MMLTKQLFRDYWNEADCGATFVQAILMDTGVRFDRKRLYRLAKLLRWLGENLKRLPWRTIDDVELASIARRRRHIRLCRVGLESTN